MAQFTITTAQLRDEAPSERVIEAEYAVVHDGGAVALNDYNGRLLLALGPNTYSTVERIEE